MKYVYLLFIDDAFISAHASLESARNATPIKENELWNSSGFSGKEIAWYVVYNSMPYEIREEVVW